MPRFFAARSCVPLTTNPRQAAARIEAATTSGGDTSGAPSPGNLEQRSSELSVLKKERAAWEKGCSRFASEIETLRDDAKVTGGTEGAAAATPRPKPETRMLQRAEAVAEVVDGDDEGGVADLVVDQILCRGAAGWATPRGIAEGDGEALPPDVDAVIAAMAVAARELAEAPPVTS